MTSYGGFAQIYDSLMDEVDYEKWAKYLQDIMHYNNVTARHVLDLACGTGNITIPLSQLGYSLWGVDISEQMLSIAENKARVYGERIRFLRQDMRNLSLTKSFDAVVCACDGVNYITDEKELIQVFKEVYKILNPGGIFIFDISSFFKLESILGDNMFIEEKNGIFYCWENSFDEESSTVAMRLNFFIPEGKLYTRIEEIHIQKAYKIHDIYEMLLKSGYTKIKDFDEFTFEKANEKSERVFFSAIK
ncbi:class I SAM-dependent DNA methyltransferase [Lutispora thermophila]|uniref:Methyltransferase domain-containing protein n=1 Tax=Lutispora thermophila DSM 19022 TaxID=1122184 RepID=A0A1M6GMR7_9FIRM|nr:class I SAM-dependent methyltransferase [Lutispora thermophila]SHJ11210.1 Methyltransferase domain-containing protein [Lutispora thermophila DSM 19022]